MFFSVLFVKFGGGVCKVVFNFIQESAIQMKSIIIALFTHVCLLFVCSLLLLLFFLNGKRNN